MVVGSTTVSIVRTARAQLVYPASLLPGITTGAVVSNVGERKVAFVSWTNRIITTDYMGNLTQNVISVRTLLVVVTTKLVLTTMSPWSRWLIKVFVNGFK